MCFSKERLSLLFFISAIFSINSLSVNPAYLLGIFCIVMSFFYKKQCITTLESIMFLYLIISCVFFNIGIVTIQPYINNMANYMSTYLFVYSIALPICFLNIFKDVSVAGRISIYRISYHFLILFMTLDLVIRIMRAESNYDFYSYKFGLFYWDSNFSGVIILLALMFKDYLTRMYGKLISTPESILLVLLLISSFSRAAILVYFFYKILFEVRVKYLKILLPLIIGCGILLVSYVSYLYINGADFKFIDGSFNSKFYFIQIALEKYSDLPIINKLFGIGWNNFQYISGGYFAHNILITLVYELGVLGTLLIVMLIIYCYKSIGFSLNYILLPYITVGFSLFSAHNLFFFILLVCMFVENRSREGEGY